MVLVVIGVKLEEAIEFGPLYDDVGHLESVGMSLTYQFDVAPSKSGDGEAVAWALCSGLELHRPRDIECRSRSFVWRRGSQVDQEIVVRRFLEEDCVRCTCSKIPSVSSFFRTFF